jgi:DNA-binding winged helix-turn-helix (wHTH) protein
MDETPIVLAHEKPFRIGPVEVRPATRELVHDGRSEILEPRVMQVLVVLHRATGAVVSKDDLIRLCWDGRLVGEDAINRVLSRLRHDADEKAGGAFRIETITRVGYRLVAAGAPAGQGIAAAPVSRRRSLVIGGGAIVAAAGAGLAWKMLDQPDIPPEAARLHEQGWDALREGTVDQLANASAKFRSAVEIAPNVAKFWGSLAFAYQLQAQSSPAVQVAALRAKGVAAARRAFALDPDDPDAIASEIVSIRLFQNWQAYERASRAAVARAPHHPGVNGALSGMLAQVGRLRESVPYIERAVAAQPMAPRLRVSLVNAYWDVDRIEEAEKAIEEAYRLWPRHYAIWFSRFYFLAFNGRPLESLAMIADEGSRPIGIPEWNFETTALQATALANPDSEVVETAVDKTLAMARRAVGFAEGAIRFLGVINRMDAAYSVIEGYYFDRGFALGDRRYSQEQGVYAAQKQRHTYMLFAARTSPLRRDPRFGPLLVELGLEDYWRATGTKPDFRTTA